MRKASRRHPFSLIGSKCRERLIKVIAANKIKIIYLFLHSNFSRADVAELVDALDLGSSAARRGGSSPFIRTS
jgi:hypothetical protein